VGVVEIVCGTLIILGFLTRLASIPLIIIMIVAIVSTKVPILLGHDFWIFHVPKLTRYDLWSMLHEARTDFDTQYARRVRTEAVRPRIRSAFLNVRARLRGATQPAQDLGLVRGMF
jgi:hypothetical protein